MSKWLKKYENERRITNARKSTAVQKLEAMGLTDVFFEFLNLDEVEAFVAGKVPWKKLKKNVIAAIVFNRGIEKEEADKYAANPKKLMKLDRRDPFPKYEPPCPETPARIMRGGLPS